MLFDSLTARSAFLCLVLASAGSICYGAGHDAPPLFAERFDGKLSDGWSWVREDPAAWKMENGSLTVRVQPGYLHADEKESNRTKNVLLRELPIGAALPLAVEVCVESEPQIQFEHAGVIWYVDDANFVDLLHEGLAGKGSILMVTKTANHPVYGNAACHSNKLWLRLILSGDDVTGQFRESPDDSWQTVAMSRLPTSGKARVGIICGGGQQNSDRVAKFSDFRIVSLAK